MARALRQQGPNGREERKQVNWTKRMSDNIAAALLVYTGLHILVTMDALEGDHGSILPYFALVFLVAAIIPGCRLFEKRWEELAASGAPDSALRGLFYRDLLVLWLAALGLPVLVTGLVKGALALI